MAFGTAILFTVAYVLLRDAPHLSWMSALGLTGAVAVALAAVTLADVLLARVTFRPGPVALGLKATAWVGLVGWPCVYAGLRFADAGDALPRYAMVLLIVPLLLGGALFRLQLRVLNHSPLTGASYALALLFAFTWMHSELGTFEAIRPGTSLMHLGIYAGTWALTVASWLLLCQRPQLPHRSRVSIALVAAAMGIVMLEADRALLVGLYTPVHQWLGFLGLLLLHTGAAGLSVAVARRVPGRALLLTTVLGFAMLLASCAVPFALAAPTARAELAQSPLGSSMLESLHDFDSQHGSDSGNDVAEHEALQFAQYLDEPPPVAGHNILLVTVDALRADVLQPGTKSNELVPNLQRFAHESAHFLRAYTGGTRTAIGLTTLMFGRYSAHVDWQLWPYADGKIFDPSDPDTSQKLDRLDGHFVYTTLPNFDAVQTLPQRIKAAGYTTLAVPYAGTNKFFQKGAGFDRGFDHFADLTKKRWKLPTSGKLTKLAERQRRRAKAGAEGPWFQWIHYYDPHESKKNRRRYDRLLRKFDRAFGRLIEDLKRSGQWERTVVAVVADHGEAFGEHPGGSHGTTLFEEQARVPLVLRIPGLPPKVLEEPVASIDLTATLLVLAGADSSELDGVNLLPLIAEDRAPAGRPVFTELHRYLSNKGRRTTDLKALISARSKLIYDRRKGVWYLYDLEKDPLEKRNILAKNPEKTQQMQDILLSFIRHAEARHPLP